MYLIEGTPNQTHQDNIDYFREPSYTEMFFTNSIILPLHTNIYPQNLQQLLALVPTDIPLQPLLFTPPPL